MVVKVPVKKMAVTLLAPISDIGRRVLALLRSVFMLILDAFGSASRRVLQLFASTSPSAPSSSEPAANHAKQTENPRSATDPSAAAKAASDSNDVDDQLPAGEEGESDDATMTAGSSENAAPLPKLQPQHQLPRKVSVPNIIPALPRLPLLSKRENAAPKSPTAPATPTDGPAASSSAPPTYSAPEGAITQLGAGLEGLRLGPQPRGNANAALLSQSQAAVQETPAPANDGKRSAENLVPSRNLCRLGLDPDSNGPDREVLRYPAVPLSHDVSQTSKLKETSIMVGQDTVHIQTQARVKTPEEAAERAIHSGFMREALDMARLALKTNETPVGCVLVYKNRVIARGMNATNVSRNGTRHAELMALCALLSYSPASDTEAPKDNAPVKKPGGKLPLGSKTNDAQQPPAEETNTWGDVDPRDGHLYPYGQKLHPAPRVDRSVINECTLYVTVEPCVMCASLLRQFGIKKVYFGAVNDKFGGTGGVFRIHKNSPDSIASAPPSPLSQNGKGMVRPAPEHRPASTTGVADPQTTSGDETDSFSESNESLPGDGGNVERGYEVEGGWGRDEAVTLLRQFYVQENGRAPVPRKKEGRAARLAAMMERGVQAGGPAPIDPEADKENGEIESPTESKVESENRDPATADPDVAHGGMP